MDINKNILDVAEFNERIIGAYNAGQGEMELPADEDVARSLIAPGTGALRDFSYIAPDIPLFHPENCIGCMDCVTECPDTAILGKVVEPEHLEEELSKISDEGFRDKLRKDFTKTVKYHTNPEKQGKKPGLFGIFIDPTKCKGCGECVEVCGDKNALSMIHKESGSVEKYREAFDFFKSLGPTKKEFILEKSVNDMMLADEGILFVGGAGSCMGCGEATALRMLMAATGFVYGRENIGLVASTGCNTVYASTYPYNPFLVPWTNSLFENSTTVAMGVRARWDQKGWQDKKIWCIGGDGAMADIGFQALSRMLASGMDIKVIVLDTQVYSNTGGQASTTSFTGQDSQMSSHGKVIHGKTERRKEIGNIAMMHPDVFVAQTTAAIPNHFYKAAMMANEFKGPAVLNVYTTCQPEHKVADDMSSYQAKLAVTSRAFPIFIYDPRKGESLKERLSLQGNQALKEDWYKNPKTGEIIDFIYFAKTEGRFGKHFDKDGNPSESLLKSQDDRLKNWHLLQELAGVK